MTRDVPLVLAHRGASAEAPENTLEAFGLAVAQGADGVELDVRITADGALVVHHDATYADGSSVWATPSQDRPPGVPLLADTLDVCGGVLVNIEIKNMPGDLGEDVPHAFDVVDMVGDLVLGRRPHRPDERVVVSSFDEPSLMHLRRLYPTVDAALLTYEVGTEFSTPERAAEAGMVALNPWDLLVDEAVKQRCDRLGLGLNVWTVNDPERIAALGKLGVASVITDVPVVALEALGRA